MKKIIAGLLCAAAVSGATFAQEATLYNKLGMTAVTQAAEEDAPIRFGHIYDEVRGTYESDMFSLWGQVKLGVAARSADKTEIYDFSAPNGDWSKGSKIIGQPLFNAAFRPVEFFEVIAGTNAGDEGLWSAAYLPGAYGYGSDFYYGLSKWASGEGLTVAFRGAGVGLDGLTIGWNVLQLENDLVTKVKDKNKLTWKTALAASYIIPDLVGVGFGAKIDSTEDANQKIGFYGELLAVENLKASLGITLDTNTSWYYFGNNLGDLIKTSADAGNTKTDANKTLGWEKELVASLNLGAEYNLSGLIIGADLGMVLGQKEVAKDVTVMPLAVGGFVAYNFTDQLKLDGRVTYETPLVSESKYNVSLITVEPRVWYNLTEVDELRLDVPLKVVSNNNTHTTGFDVECYWKHSF